MKAKDRFLTVCCAVAAAGFLFTVCPVKALAAESGAEASSADKCYEEASDLLEQFDACENDAEKRELLGISDNNLSNDSFRSKLCSDNGGQWDELETEVLAATANLQDRVLYVQPFMLTQNGAIIQPVIYAGSVSEAVGTNRWATNLVYDAENSTWYEYDNVNQWGTLSSYSMTNLWNHLSWDEFMTQVNAEGSYWKPISVSSGEGQSDIDDEDNGGTPAGDEDNGNTPAGDEDNGGTPAGDEDNGSTPAGDEDNGSTPAGDEDNGGTPAGDEDNSNTPAGDEDDTVMEEEETPLVQPEDVIEDEDIPLAQPEVTSVPVELPATGDHSVIPAASGLALASLAVCLLLGRKKVKK